MMKKMLCGLMLVLLGIVFLLHNLEILPYSFELFRYWPIFVMLIGLGDVFDRGKLQSDSIVLIVIGGFLLLYNFDILDFDLLWKLFFPSIVIIIGLAIMFSKDRQGTKEFVDTNGDTTVHSVSSDINDKNEPNEFSKGKVSAIFQGATLDLKDATFSDKSHCQVTSIFGGVDLLLPDDVVVNTDGLTCIFGGVDDYRKKEAKKTIDEEEAESNSKRKKNTEKKKVLYLIGTIIFGGVDIK